MTLIWVDTPIPQELLLPNHVSVPDVFPNLQDAYPQLLALTCLVSHSQHMLRWSHLESDHSNGSRTSGEKGYKQSFCFTDCFPLSRKSQARSTHQASHGWDEPRRINDSWDEFFGKFFVFQNRDLYMSSLVYGHTVYHVSLSVCMYGYV